MFSLEERERAVGWYFTTPMTTAQVVEHLGHPTRQCPERRPAADPRYAGHMAKPIIPLETRRRAVELVPGGMQQKQAAKQLGAGVGAVHGWVRAYRKGGMAALQPKNMARLWYDFQSLTHENREWKETGNHAQGNHTVRSGHVRVQSRPDGAQEGRADHRPDA